MLTQTRILRSGVAILLLVCCQNLPGASIVVPERPSERPHLKSIYASIHDLTEVCGKDTPATVFVFLRTDCPVSQQYLPRLKSLHDSYRDRGVRFVGIYGGAGVDRLTMAAHAHDQDIPFPVFQDLRHRLADLLDAQVTPEVVVIDAKLEKRYQGAIDNQFKKGGKLTEETETYLNDALTHILGGDQVERPYVPASGCLIERQVPAPFSDPVTFHRDVLPILQRHCQTCHRPGGAGPFALITYENAYGSAERISEVVQEGRMPPWHGYLNSKFGELANDKRLDENDRRTLEAWAAQDAPEGDRRDAPSPTKWPASSDWQIGKPDYVYKIKPFRVPKSGVLEYQFFHVKLDFPEERWFQGVEVKPGNAGVVHHVGLHMVPACNQEFSGMAAMVLLYGLNTEKAQLINDYVPGDLYNAKRYPPGQAVKIPPKSDLVFEVHYTPNNREAVTDQSMVAFQWAAGPPREEIFTAVFRKPIGRFKIPPFEPHHRIEDTYYFPQDVYVDAIRPHFHLRGKSYRLEFIERDPKTDEITNRETILTVPVFDPNWQRTYELKTPLLVRAGQELLATGHFDNSRFNPNNPNPAAEVQWGQQSSDEMFSTRFKYRLVKRNSAATAKAAE